MNCGKFQILAQTIYLLGPNVNMFFIFYQSFLSLIELHYDVKEILMKYIQILKIDLLFLFRNKNYCV